MKPPFGNVRSAHVSVELLSSYLDRQVSMEEQLRVEQHLRTCTSCRTELDNLRQTVALMHALPRVLVPRAFTLSEAQVGVRRPAGRPWFWGAARAIGAVAAVIVVAVVAVQLLQRPGQQPAMVARAPQPAAAPAAATQAQPETAAPSAAAAVPAPQAAAPDTAAPPAANAQTVQQPTFPPAAAPARPAAPQAPARTSPPVTSAPAAALRSAAPTGKRPSTTAPAQPTQTRPFAAAPLASKAAPAAAATAAPASPTAPQTLAMAPQATGGPAAGAQAKAAAAEAAAPGAPTAASTVESLITPTGEAAQALSAAAAAPAGRGGGPSSQPTLAGPGSQGQFEAGQAAPPPAAASSSALPGNAGVLYRDGQTLTALDARGTHSLTSGQDTWSPTVAPDRKWVAYQVARGDGNEIWATRWDGSGAHRIASSSQFPGREEGIPQSVQFARTEWVPGGHTLALTVAVPDGTAPGEPRMELWTANAEDSGPRYVLELGSTGTSFFAPDGKMVAVLRRGNPAADPPQPRGQIYLYRSDGSDRRLALEVPANANGFGYDTQLAWSPDNSGLWAGVPDPDAQAPERSSLGLYRIPLRGAAYLAGHIVADETFWSPDTRRLAFVRSTDGTYDKRELVLAGPDGSQAQSYAAINNGTLGSWSPDSRQFTYQSGDQWFVGGPDQAPQALGPAGAISQPHWIGPGQLLYLLNQGQNWVLVMRSADGKAASLAHIPMGSEVSITGR